jgi:hypothetical protein
MEEYAPGDRALMKRWRESWAMMTLSTAIYDVSLDNPGWFCTRDSSYRNRYSRIHRRGLGDDTSP